MDIAVMLRIERFRNPFFTGVSAEAVLPTATMNFTDYAPVDLQQEVQSLMNPVAPFGSAIVGTVEDLQAQTRIKVQRARQAVDSTFDLLGFDLIQGSLWMDVRKAQDAGRNFGAAPTAAWTALRQHVPLRLDPASNSQSISLVASQFLRTTPASTFYRGTSPPGGEP
jgi:histidine ammonia-lyase